ncbi:MAG: ABC transporter ATP-binding protein, partial [Pseudolabrys sp.]
MNNDIILETEDLTKEFAGFVAVSGVSLKVARGTIHALIGPNGAGKTTCFNLLTKFLAPTKGRIRYKGRDITALAPADVARLGLVRSFQISAVFPHMTVLENVRIALQRQRGTSFDFWRSSKTLDQYNERALALIADVGLSSFVEWQAVELPYGGKRALEIATTLALDPEMMLLDEPMAGKGHED